MAPPVPLQRPAEAAAELRGRLGSTGDLAKERYVPLLSPLASVLAQPGLARGTTVVFEGGGAPGTTSLALALLAAATGEGMWCSVLGLPSLGCAAADELGVSLERLVLVTCPPPEESKFLATLLDACDVVCAALSRPLAKGDARRLVARARERRGVLVLLPAPRARPRGLWPEVGDLTLSVLDSRFVGLGEGEGRISARLVEVGVRSRRGAPPERHARLWLPAPGGGVAADPETVVELPPAVAALG